MCPGGPIELRSPDGGLELGTLGGLEGFKKAVPAMRLAGGPGNGIVNSRGAGTLEGP